MATFVGRALALVVMLAILGLGILALLAILLALSSVWGALT